jgi:replicative DNA helicase
MLTEQFINLCCVILLSDDNPKINESNITEISLILNSYNEESIALQFRKKFELSKSILKLKLERKTSEQIIDSILSTGHFSELESYIKGLEGRKLTVEKTDSALSQVSERKQYCSLIQQDLPKLEDFIKKIHSNSFTDLGESLSYWNQLIPVLHTRVLEAKRKESRAAIKELDLFSDSYDEVLNQIAISYSGKNSVSTGYSGLDHYMNGGFEPTRLYIYGGTSGDGKSVLLNNFVRNAVEKNQELTGPKNIFLYFTLENLIDESLVRLYCSIMKEKVIDLIGQYDEKRKTIEKTLKEWMLDHNSIVVMSYFPPTLTSVSDLISYSDIVKHRYGEKAKIRAAYTDYLDLLKSGQTFDLHRLELGQVTIDMKVAAVMMGIPYITVTQLNRGAYDDKSGPSLVNMSESIKKVEHSDHVALIKNKIEDKDDKDIRLQPEVGDFRVDILKNRSGPKNVGITLKSNFSKFRIFDDSSPDMNPSFAIPKQDKVPDSIF